MSDKRKRETLFRRASRQLLSRKMVVASMVVVAVYLLVALLGFLDVLPDYQERVGAPYQAPSWSWPLLFGTDIFGRSVFYKILAGTKTAMVIGLLVPAIAIPIGLILGALAGYYGGTIDALVVWLFSV